MEGRIESDVPSGSFAWFSEEGASWEEATYRWLLTRNWGERGRAPNTAKVITWVMLNPSTASHLVDDPTIAKCSRFSKKWGFEVMHVVNLFALRSTDPKGLHRVEDPVGHLNDLAITDAVRCSQIVICAWGNDGNIKGRGRHVVRAVHDAELEGRLAYLRRNNDGNPAHPLYQREDLNPIPWSISDQQVYMARALPEGLPRRKK